MRATRTDWRCLRQYGVLAGGLETGAVVLWNPANVVDAGPGDASASQVASLAKHTGAVRNPPPKHLQLCCGSS